MNVQIDDMNHVDRKVWDEYVLTHPSGDHYHLSGWGRVIEVAYKYRSLYYTAWDGLNITGVLPMIIFRSFFQKSLISLPFLDYGGICADHIAAAQRLYQTAQGELTKRGASILDLRHRRETTLPLEGHGDKVTMILGLSAAPEEMWKSFAGKVRNQIRKAEKEKLEAQWIGEEGLKDFYHIYLCNMRDLGSPPHSLRFFQRILVEFPETQVLLVRRENQVIGGAICLLFRDTMLVPWASSLRAYFRMCPNNLLYWEAIRTACERGLQRFDFGRSSKDGGTYKFKKQWGALEEPLYWQSNISGRNLLNEEDNAVLGHLVQAWKKLPVSVTRCIGPVLRKRLSN